MASENHIKEFLVGLGFEIDEAGLHRFGGILGDLGKSAASLGLKLSAMAAAAFYATTRMAEAFESLYYLSQRTSTSVDNLVAMQHAFGQVGLSADQANSAISNLAMALRSNPGTEGLLGALGIHTRNASGGALPATEVMTNLLERLATMPFQIAQQFGQTFGIPPGMLIQLLQNLPKMRQEHAEWNEIVRKSGANLDEAAKAGENWMNSLRSLRDALYLVYVTVEGALVRSTEPLIKEFTKYIVDHFGDIHDTLVKTAEYIGTFFGYFGDGAKALIGWFSKLNDATHGWLGTVTEVGAALIALGAAAAISPLGTLLLAIMAIVAAVGYIYDNWAKVKVIIGEVADYGKAKIAEIQDALNKLTLPDILKWLFGRREGSSHGSLFEPGSQNDQTNDTTSRTQRDKEIRRLEQENIEGLHSFAEWWHNFLFGGGVQNQSYTGGGMHATPISYSPGATNMPAGAGQGAPGWFSDIEKTFGLPGGLLNGVEGAESGHGRSMQSGAGAQGWFQFMPGTWSTYGQGSPFNRSDSAMAAGRYLSKLLKEFHGNIAAALAGYNWGEGNVEKMMKQYGADWIKHLPAETSNYVNKILGGGQAQARRGYQPGVTAGAGSNVNMSNSTTINVHGTGDAHTTAREIQRHQARINADLIRDLRGAVVA